MVAASSDSLVALLRLLAVPCLSFSLALSLPAAARSSPRMRSMVLAWSCFVALPVPALAFEGFCGVAGAPVPAGSATVWAQLFGATSAGQAAWSVGSVGSFLGVGGTAGSRLLLLLLCSFFVGYFFGLSGGATCFLRAPP